MKLSDNAMCAVLLCSYIGLRSDSTIKPLSLGEWNSFLDKVIERGLEPKVIFEREKDLGTVLSYPEEEVTRIRELSSRGGANMAFVLGENTVYNANAVEKAAERFCVAKGQMNVWLKRMCDEGVVECKRGVYSKAGGRYEF